MAGVKRSRLESYASYTFTRDYQAAMTCATLDGEPRSDREYSGGGNDQGGRGRCSKTDPVLPFKGVTRGHQVSPGH